MDKKALISLELVFFIVFLNLTTIPMRDFVYASPYTDISVDIAYDMITNGSYPNLVILDVRNKTEYDSGHIYGAVWIPHTQLDARINELAGHENHEIIVYCKSGVRSRLASETLEAHNFTKVFNMLGGITEWEDSGYPVWIATVHNLNTSFNYDTIQAALDAPQTLDGHLIFVDNGTYFEHVVVNKSVSIIGENVSSTIVNGNGTGTVFFVNASDVTIKGFRVENGTIGIKIENSNNSAVIGNHVVYNVDAIILRYSYNCTVYQNLVENNTNRGILVTNSQNFTVNSNYVYGSGYYGINANSSVSGVIRKNYVEENLHDGIGLAMSSNSCLIEGNTIINNRLFGILIELSSNNNNAYHNNIISNGIQTSGGNPTNKWDNGFEGNYWSDYTGIDLNHDGIGDSPYVISDDSVDNHPLMGMFHSFNVSLKHSVDVISNSTIDSFHYFYSNSTIRLYVSNMTTGQTHGFCRVSIPYKLMNVTNIQVMINDGNIEVLNANYTLYDNGTHRWIYFAYSHSTRKIDIIPEFPSTIMLLTILIIMTVSTFFVKKRLLRRCGHG